jgi:hypothetical protein
MIFRAVLGLITVFIAYRLYKLFLGFLEYKRQVAAGVVFPNGFSLYKDLIDLKEVI